MICFAEKFSTMFDMIKKLQEAQKKMKEIKSKLDQMTAEGTSADGSIKVIINGNRVVKAIEISENSANLGEANNNAKLVQAVNSAIAAADRLNESEMKEAAGSMMPGLGNLMGG